MLHFSSSFTFAPLALRDASDYAIGGALHQVVDLSYSHWLSFPENLLSEKSYSAYDRELLAIYSAIRHFRAKKVTSVLHDPSAGFHLLKFTTNIVHIPGSDNIVADVLSRVSAITFPSQIDYDCIAETQQTDQSFTPIASGTSLNSKSAIKCHATERWTGEVLPIILLGLRASLKEDILCTPAELVLGPLFDCQEMFDSSEPDDDVANFVSKLKSHMQSLHPKPPKHHGKRPVFIHPGLLEATHVFLRRDMLHRPFNNPMMALSKSDKGRIKCFPDINVNGYLYLLIDANLPSFLTLRTCNYLKPRMKTPATVEPNATASTPATVESDPTAFNAYPAIYTFWSQSSSSNQVSLTLEGEYAATLQLNITTPKLN
ncbi:RT_RNaseH domain-containing protein [Trichonephila clavipes]|nr:RT_RNaseH domain-containing protein [Trichonephila clavipes]